MPVSAHWPRVTWHAWRRGRMAAQARDANLAALLRTPPPDQRRHWRETNWLALDIETTSLDPRNARLVSIGWVPLRAERIVLAEAVHFTVSDNTSVGQSAVVHRITDSERVQGRKPAETLALLWRALAGHIPVMHGAALDIAVIDRLAQLMFGAPWMPWHADTLWLERRRRERRNQPVKGGELTLAALRAAYRLPPSIAHHALSDAVSAAELFLAQCAGSASKARELLR